MTYVLPYIANIVLYKCYKFLSYCKQFNGLIQFTSVFPMYKQDKEKSSLIVNIMIIIWYIQKCYFKLYSAFSSHNSLSLNSNDDNFSNIGNIFTAKIKKPAAKS